MRLPKNLPEVLSCTKLPLDLPSQEVLSNAIAKRGDSVFAADRSTQLLAAASGEPGYNEAERLAAPFLISMYMGTLRQAASRFHSADWNEGGSFPAARS